MVVNAESPSVGAVVILDKVGLPVGPAPCTPCARASACV